MKINSNMTAETAQGFQIYHFGWKKDKKVPMLEKYRDLGFMNVYQFQGDYALMREMAAKGAKFWAYIQNIGFWHKNEDGKHIYGINDNWREVIDERVQTFKDEGIWDAVLGFEWDEPMLQSTNELVEMVAEYLAQFGKRQFAIFSVYEIKEGSHPRSTDPEFGKEGHIINEQSCRFFTDIGFDWYSNIKYEDHLWLLNEMKRRVGRDPYIWFVPCTWSISNRFGQEHAVAHLDLCYKLLKEQDNPGGLCCYNWHSFGNKGESLDWLFDENNESRWTTMETRMLEIANEVINTPLKK